MNRTADRIGRGLMTFDALATIFALVNGVILMTTVADDRLITEAWRTFAYVIFAGLWAILAIRPRSLPGLWEMLLFHKAAITIFALVMLGAPEAPLTAAIDGVLVVTTALAYVLCRGWTPWQQLKR